eukprot:3645963-Amphidinium_carterae.1
MLSSTSVFLMKPFKRGSVTLFQDSYEGNLRPVTCTPRFRRTTKTNLRVPDSLLLGGSRNQ